LLLATDRLMNVVEAFKVHQPVAMVFAAKPSVSPALC
jgi:hypothetical protein